MTKKYLEKLNLELEFVFWREKKSKIYNIYGPEGSWMQYTPV